MDRKSVILFWIAFLFVTIHSTHAQKQFTIEAIYGKDSEFREKSVRSVHWLPKSGKFSYSEEQEGVKSIWSYDLQTSQRQLITDTDKITVFKTLDRERRIIPGSYLWSPNENEILFNTGNDLYLYSIESKKLNQLTTEDQTERDPTFSPDGTKIAFIKEHNLYVLDIASREVIQLTTEGQEHILIGRFDWVYEEEFGIRTGFFWSPNSKYIAFFQLDESVEPEFPIVDYVPVHNTVENLRYPKPGDQNAIVKIGVVSVEKPQIQWMDIGEEIDIYIPRIKWLNDSQRLAIYRLNRQQNQLELLFADIHTGTTKMILEENENHGWIDIHDDLTFLKNSDLFIWSSDRAGFRHLYLYDLDGKLIRPLTQGSWDVENVVRVDEKNKRVYFMATAENIFERHLYQINFSGKGLKKISNGVGNHRINMHPECTHYLHYFSDYTTPTKVLLRTSEGKIKDVIESNEIKALTEYRLSKPAIISFTTEDGITLNAEITKPADFDSTQKYPVLFNVYGGPGSQTVLNNWGGSGYLWGQLLTQKGYIIFQLDNRGTGARGSQFMKQMYRKLGYFEVEDMIQGVKYLRTLPYIDAERIGIWGWSYGGYTTIMCMLKAADYFKVGVAVAPVTDWKNYDTIYTERYMDTLESNLEGYENSSANKYANNLKGKLLLIHGSADDNVHLSNTMQLAHEFQRLNKPFHMMIYPRKMHGIGEVRDHLFHQITDYILKNL